MELLLSDFPAKDKLCYLKETMKTVCSKKPTDASRNKPGNVVDLEGKFIPPSNSDAKFEVE